MTRTHGAAKRVLFFDDRYYAAQGAQKLLVHLAVFARDAGLDVAVGSTRDGALLDLAAENGLETIVLGMPSQLDKWGGELRQGSPSSAWRTTWALARQNVALARQVRERGYDLVWAAAMRAMLSLLATSFVLRVPVVWQIMGSGYFRGFSELASLAATRIVLIADGLTQAVGVLRFAVLCRATHPDRADRAPRPARSQQSPARPSGPARSPGRRRGQDLGGVAGRPHRGEGPSRRP